MKQYTSAKKRNNEQSKLHATLGQETALVNLHIIFRLDSVHYAKQSIILNKYYISSINCPINSQSEK